MAPWGADRRAREKGKCSLQKVGKDALVLLGERAIFLSQEISFSLQTLDVSFASSELALQGLDVATQILLGLALCLEVLQESLFPLEVMGQAGIRHPELSHAVLQGQALLIQQL